MPEEYENQMIIRRSEPFTAEPIIRDQDLSIGWYHHVVRHTHEEWGKTFTPKALSPPHIECAYVKLFRCPIIPQRNTRSRVESTPFESRIASDDGF